MDPLSALLRKRTQRRVALGIGLAIGTAIAASLWWNASRAPAPLAPETDARIERALAREAERAVREGPRDEPPVFAADGLRALGEHWRLQPDASPAARWTPDPLTPDDLLRPRDPAPVPRGGLARATRALPPQSGDPALRLRSGARALSKPE